MKLERYKDKKETRKKVILISLTVVTIVSVAMMLYKTFANFRTTTSFTIMSGKVIYKKKGIDLSKDVPVVSDGEDNGLFKVEHSTSGIDNAWNQAEYRYAGKEPDNYVTFNDELWRIIGLVNVKTSGGVEQRLKLIRNKTIGRFSWNNNSVSNNEWTQSALKNMLNSIYYNSEKGSCYSFNIATYSDVTTCDFTGNGEYVKGLNKIAQNMIDDEVIWPLGGCVDSNVTPEQMYTCERSVNVSYGHQTEWTKVNNPTYHKGIAMMYASDSGFAVGGSVRNSCLTKKLFESSSECYNQNWILSTDLETVGWFLSHPTNSSYAFYRWLTLYIADSSTTSSYSVNPSIYLKSNVKITSGSGKSTDPYQLENT